MSRFWRLRKMPRVKNYKRNQCKQGHWHHSIKEANYCNKLELLKRAKEIKGYQTQVKFEFIVNNQKICSHIVDFVVENNDGSKEVHEVKGWAQDIWRIKRNLFVALYPYMEYISTRNCGRFD